MGKLSCYDTGAGRCYGSFLLPLKTKQYQAIQPTYTLGVSIVTRYRVCSAMPPLIVGGASLNYRSCVTCLDFFPTPSIYSRFRGSYTKPLYSRLFGISGDLKQVRLSGLNRGSYPIKRENLSNLHPIF